MPESGAMYLQPISEVRQLDAAKAPRRKQAQPCKRMDFAFEERVMGGLVFVVHGHLLDAPLQLVPN